MSTIHIVILGAAGRMGRRLTELASIDPELTLAGAVVRGGADQIGLPASLSPHAAAIGFISADDVAGPVHAIIDFSSDSGVFSAIALTEKFNAALVVGTTALSTSSTSALRELSARRPVLVTPNTSLGVAAVADAVSRLARHLGPGYTCSILEIHHTRKKDAPSGTALRLAHAARAGSAVINDADIHSERTGEVVGTHTVTFAGPCEVIELTHRATSRDLFALGALHAAKWLSRQQPGWYTIEDVLHA